MDVHMYLLWFSCWVKSQLVSSNFYVKKVIQLYILIYYYHSFDQSVNIIQEHVLCWVKKQKYSDTPRGFGHCACYEHVTVRTYVNFQVS